jgi:hypothetical protein
MGGALRGRPKWRGCTRGSSRPVAAVLGSGALPRVVGVACFRVALYICRYILRLEAPNVKGHSTIKPLYHLYEVCKSFGITVIELKDIPVALVVPCFPKCVQQQ